MKEQKYKIGDKVWFMRGNKPEEKEITGVMIKGRGGDWEAMGLALGISNLHYQFTDVSEKLAMPRSINLCEYFDLSEDVIFSSKEELLKSL